jgi:hypothetical protein
LLEFLYVVICLRVKIKKHPYEILATSVEVATARKSQT